MELTNPYFKAGFAGTWHQSWISLRGATDFCYTLSDSTAASSAVGDHEEERVDLKKTKGAFHLKSVGLNFGSKNGIRFHFYSGTLLNCQFSVLFLGLGNLES